MHPNKKQKRSQFEAYASTLFDFKDPAQVKLFAQIYPQYYKRRFAVIDNVANAQSRYAKLMLTGPQNANDIEFMYLAQSGRVPLISGPLWNPSAWFKSEASDMKLALFNPFKPLTQKDQLPIPGGINGVYTTPGLPGVTGKKDLTSGKYTPDPKYTAFIGNYPAENTTGLTATPSGGGSLVLKISWDYLHDNNSTSLLYFNSSCCVGYLRFLQSLVQLSLLFLHTLVWRCSNRHLRSMSQTTVVILVNHSDLEKQLIKMMK